VNDLRTKTNEIVKQAVANELGNPGDYVVYNFTPLTDIYLKSEVDEPEVTGSILYVYVFAAIAILILITACINYVNLATAKASDRAREVGIRKVVGAVRAQLFFQFISESLIVTLFGFCLAFLLSQLALPLFNSLTGKSFVGTDLLNATVLSWCAMAWVSIAFLAGIYPALAITSFKPVSVLKGNFKRSNKGIWLRQSLVVFQFSVSIILMIGTAVILQQLKYIQNKKLGYDRENVVVLPLDRQAKEKYQQLKTEFERTGFVVDMGRATEAPTKINGGYGIKLPGSKSELGMVVRATAIDEDLVPTLRMKVTTGRNFNEADYKRYSVDSVMAIIVNQSTLKELGVKEDEALTTTVSFSGGKTVIVGVVEDFHFSSLQEKISPLVLFAAKYDWDLNNAFVKLKPGNVREQLEELKKISTSLLPHRPFEYEFLDQKYQKMYDKEQRMGKITTVFSALAIAIASLGLLGLVAFAAAQKTKEIGIRKVMGATSSSIVGLITKDYMKLVIIALLIGIPSAWYILNEWWLGSFAYHTTIGAMPLVLSALGCLFIAFATASYQAIKAAWTDPTKTLRSE
jgi:putative ABC transport system permease protein